MDGGQHPSNGQAERAAIIATWPEALRVEFEERAGILEYDGGLTRDWAELKAFIAVQDAEIRRRTEEGLHQRRSSQGPQHR